MITFGPGGWSYSRVLLVLGYFCHLVSLVLTVAGLAVLTLFAPAQAPLGSHALRENWYRRLTRTALCLLPLVPLAAVYLKLSRQGGPMHPLWANLTRPDSFTAWGVRLGWVDPVTLSRKMVLPFTERTSMVYAVFAPVIWLCVAVLVYLAGPVVTGLTRKSRSGESEPLTKPATFSRGSTNRQTQAVWVLYGGFLLLGGLLGPDSLGPEHGHYLAQRLILLGMAVLVPAIDVPLTTKWGQLTAACLLAAIGLQTVIIWDYALYCKQTDGQIIGASELVGRGQRVAPLLTGIRSRFRPDPLLHADSWLGIGTGNILWSNYEARYYYFPVQFRPGLDRPDPKDFEWLSRTSDPRVGESCVRLWDEILSGHSRSTDRVVAWKSDPWLDTVTGRWFDLAAQRGDVRVFASLFQGIQTKLPPSTDRRTAERDSWTRSH